MFEGFASPAFVPAHDVLQWAIDTFIDEDATLLNEEHAHLRHASLAFMWTTVPNTRAGHRIVGQCEIMPPMAMGKWQKARAEQQIEEWFGSVPDFLITLDASYAAQCDVTEFCSLVEHELLHAGQEMGPMGPKFRKSGKPTFAIRGHDVEEFVSIVRRYGVGAAAGATQALVEVACRRPEVGAVQISQACGTCRLLRAA
ncbi:MAG: putative metallopeptidase [Phenylobacterium sp.]|uniref:putative metallopeptidase n=1 Tax=Phenylobacterium sp. TaxID=1871053 RepID=UPI002718DDE4|nr:putative metallopeptidase [Phenylobacterium sp.]MDO8912312.1 putative metallopeptidase [Phenylobacterium sp.]MDP3099524.1 putative metallopeptidase [Phenylobacterium sp.]